jgi:hypothetical protein
LLWRVFLNIAYIGIGPIFCIGEKHGTFGLWTLLTSHKIRFSSSIYLPTNDKSLFFLWLKKFHCKWIPHFLNPFISRSFCLDP